MEQWWPSVVLTLGVWGVLRSEAERVRMLPLSPLHLCEASKTFKFPPFVPGILSELPIDECALIKQVASTFSYTFLGETHAMTSKWK